MDEFDKALEYLDAPSTPTATPGATTATPSISEVNNHNVDVMIGALKDLNVDVSKGEEGVLKGTMKGWKRASVISGSDASAPTISTSRSTEANKKDEARKAASNRKREARRAALAAYEKKERFKEQLNEQPNKQPEVKKTRSLFLSRRKSAPAGSLNAPVSPLSVPASSSELDLKKIDELEWRSFNTWVLDLASGLRDCSSSFNRIVSKKRKEFEVEPLKNDKTYNPYKPVYVIHYFKDFWDKIKGFYGAEKVKLEGSNDVDEFIKTIDGENWEKYGWENPKFSTDPKNLKGEEPELNKNNEVIKAFDGWLEIIKKNIINLQDKVGKKNIEKISESEKKWKTYNNLVKKYNRFVAKQSKIVNSQSSEKLLERINKNDRKAQEIATRIVYPIFVDEKFEGSKGSKSAEVLKNFLTKQAQKCEAGKASTKYEKLKAILSDADMRGDAGTLCTCLRDFYNVLISSNRNLVATLLSGHANNIRNLSVNSGQLEGLEEEFNELLDGVERNIDDLGKVYDNVEKAYKDDKSIIGEDHDFIFGKDENNCWRVYQNEDGTEKEIGYIAKVYCEVVKKDEKQEKNVFLKDPNGGVIPYKGARTYGSVSSYLCGSMGYLSFENNFTPNGEIECYYTDEEGKENSVTFNANGMAIKINRQGQKKEVDESSNTFKQLKQAFEGNQSSSIPPQGNLDINNNEKNEGGINMAETETTKIEAAKRQLMDFVAEYNYFLSLRGRFAEKHMELKDDFNKVILKDYRVDWWDKFEKYELGDLSNIDFVKAQWGMVLADLIRKYLPTGELDSTMKELSNIGSEFSNAKSNEEKLNILGEYHTEARKLLKKVEDKLIDLNNFSERIKNRGSAFEGPKDKKSGSANSGANTRYVSKEEEDKFVAEKLKGLSEYKKQCEAFRIRHFGFLEKEKCKEIIDSQMDGTQFNKETWKNEPAEIKWLPGHDENRLYNLPFKYRSMAKLLINYFKEGSSEYTKYKNIIDESNSADYDEKTIQQRIDFTSKAIESLGEMLSILDDQLAELEKTAANGGQEADKNVSETNVNEDAEQKEEPKTTETVDDPKLEEGAKPAEASGAATRENGLPPIPQRGLPLTPPEQAAANGGEKTDEDVGETNVNEDAEQKEEPKATETVDDPKLEEENKLLASGLGVQAHGQLIKAVEEHDKFVDNYNKLVGKFKGKNSLKPLITKVLKKEPEEKSIWLNGDERNLRPEPGKTFNTIEELNKAWVNLINKLAEYLPEDNKAAYVGKVTKISYAIINGKYKGKDIDNSEKLKLMEKYNKMCDKMLNYTNSVLKRLEKEAKYEDPIEDDEEKSKGFFDKVKGKASKLVRKGKKVVAHKLDNSEKELDAAQKELKVADNYAGTNGTNVRFVKQSVMDQPEYAAFKAVGQIIVTKKDNFGKICTELNKYSSLKSLRNKLNELTQNETFVGNCKVEEKEGAEFEAELGILYIGIAYLPSGSKGIEAACKGMSVGGIKENNDETIQKVYNVNRAMKKFCRDGTVGHALVKKVEEQLVALVNKDFIPKIESKFSTLLKLKRKAAKLGSKAKNAAKRAAEKIGKSSVGRAAKGAASSAVDAVKKLPGKFKKSKPEATVENASAGASVPANNVSSEKKPGRAKKAWNTVKSVFSRSKKKTTNNEEDE